MIDDKYTLEQLMTGHFIKYEKMAELISQSYTGSNCNKINLFIDINSLVKGLYSIDAWGYKSVSRYEMSAIILNMCGHYRQFFRRLGVSTTIYLIYGLNCPKSNSTYVSGYNSKFVRSYMKKELITNLIDDNLAILNVITQYLPKIYFFNIGQCEVSSMVAHIIKKSNAIANGFENIVISKDILMLQLVPEYNVRILRPIKNKDGDCSIIVDNSNLWIHFYGFYRKLKSTPIDNIPNNFISNILTMTNVTERGISAIFTIPKAMKILSMAIQNGFLDPTKFYNQASVNTALAVMDVSGYNPIEFDMRYKAISTQFQSMYILPIEKPELVDYQLFDLEDVQGLKNIISRYYYNTPIDLDKL